MSDDYKQRPQYVPPEQGGNIDPRFADAASEFEGLDTVALVRALAEVRREKEDLDAKLSIVDAKHDYLRLIALVRAMEDEGITTVTVDGIGRVTLYGDVYAGMRDNKAAAYEWMRDNGHGDLITESIHPSTLKAVAKQMIVKGKPLPAEFFRITPYSRAQLTASKSR